MPKITDMQIRAWIKAGDRFEGRADGNGLYICYPKNYTVPFWRFRYKFAGKQRAMVIGSYAELSLSKARETAKELSARVALGYDVAGEKQERKAEALAKIEAEKNAMRVSELAAEYFERQILPRWKHPDILRRRIDKDINPCTRCVSQSPGAVNTIAKHCTFLFHPSVLTYFFLCIFSDKKSEECISATENSDFT